MGSKLLFTVAVCALIQGLACETIDDVVAELRPKIEDLRSKIGAQIDDDGQQIGLARSEIGTAASEAERALGIKRSELGAVVDQVRSDAAAQGKNIQNCMDAYSAAMRQVNFRGLQECRTNNELDLVGIKLGHLGALKDGLSKTIDLCVANFPNDPTEVRECGEKEIDNATKQAAGIQKDITSSIENGKKSCNTCLNETLADLVASLEKIGNDLKTCAASA